MKECLTLKKSNCKNCYKCIRNCPVKSIRFSGNQAHIIDNECILCGRCVIMCPQHAKVIAEELDSVKSMLRSGERVFVSLAPSFAANYKGVGFDAMKSALLKLGFTDVEETAIGAAIVKREYERLLRDEDRDVLISSCCPTINLLIQKYFPTLLPYLADVVSPMQAHCLDIRRRYPDVKIVFIGPCISKKDEAQRYQGAADAVLTFGELTEWLAEEGITLTRSEDASFKGRTRIFPVPGGIIQSFTEKREGYTYLSVDRTRACMDVLRDLMEGNIHKCFIEMSSCPGGCVGGPGMDEKSRERLKNYIEVTEFAGEDDYAIDQPAGQQLRKEFDSIERQLHQPTEQEIEAALKRMGKLSPADELNCGSCGYNSCREKAIAVCQGKAETSMCLPYLKERAESFSGSIVDNTPNGILVLNEDLEIQQINHAACEIMNIRKASDVMGEQIVRLMDPDMFLEVQESGNTIHDRQLYLADYDKHIVMTVVADKDNHLMFAIMRDITELSRNRERKESITRQTIEVADKVVEKQMRIVQEIASLLGETAAETKIALTGLKESIKDE